MAEKLSKLKKVSPVPKPDLQTLEDDNANDTLWSELATLDRFTEEKTGAAGDERDAIKNICDRHGLNAGALRLFRRIAKQEIEKQSDFLRTWSILEPKLACKAQPDMFEEGR